MKRVGATAGRAVISAIAVAAVATIVVFLSQRLPETSRREEAIFILAVILLGALWSLFDSIVLLFSSLRRSDRAPR